MKLMQTAFAGMAGALFAIAAQAADITGAGSTFAAPIYTKWADAYQKSGGGKVNYQGIGSSGGIKQIIAKTVDFAGSDAPLKDDELAKDGLFQFPTVVGGVVPVVNLPGMTAGRIDAVGRSARRHLPGQDQEVERPGDRCAEPEGKAAGYGYRRGAPC